MDAIKRAEELQRQLNSYKAEKGKQEGVFNTYKTQYEDALRAYNEKWGANVTNETLQSEYNEQYAQIQALTGVLEGVLERVEKGEFNKGVDVAKLDFAPDVSARVQEIQREYAKLQIVVPVTPVIEEDKRFSTERVEASATTPVNTGVEVGRTEVQGNVGFGVGFGVGVGVAGIDGKGGLGVVNPSSEVVENQYIPEGEINKIDFVNPVGVEVVESATVNEEPKIEVNWGLHNKDEINKTFADVVGKL